MTLYSPPDARGSWGHNWSVAAKLETDQPPIFEAKLHSRDGKKTELVSKDEVTQALEQMKAEIEWHQRAAGEFTAELEAYDQAIAGTIGMRMQERLSSEQAESIASCLAVHKDLTLHF